jgi:3D (Asp-Asp-Asp) domain-containing protein
VCQLGFDLIKTIQRVAIEAITPHTLQIMFGKVKSINPLTIKVGDTWTLTEEFIVLDAPVDADEDVIVIKYSTGNKYLVLSTVEKIYKSSVNVGGIVDSGYSTGGQWKSLGTFKITHYCCERYPHICNAGPPYKTATGTTPHVGGCAVDPKKIPLGSYIKINDVVYHAEDTGGSIKGNRIDIVVDTHQEALNKGMYNAEVFLKVGD